MKKKYPFKFLDAYQREDIDFFFGREDEIKVLYEMIFQSNILLVYGTSGTGKTSLIKCGLANKFQHYDWLALYVRRGNNLIASLDKIICQESDEAFAYIESKTPIIENLAEKMEAVYQASFKPLYLIFDQVEELYVLGDKAEQNLFIHTVKEILRLEQSVKIIISIREEYLGYLYEFERQVPELLRKKLRVEPMNLDKVKTVIRSIGCQPQSKVQLQTREEDAIAEMIFEKIRGTDNTLTIDLPYLQVFLDKLYLQTTGDEQRQADAVFTIAALKKMGDIGDVLRAFLDEQVQKIARELEQKPETVWHILSPLVTLDGTKEPLTEPELRSRRPKTPHLLLSTTLQALVKSRIIRFTEHDQSYEIAHDALAKQVHAKRSDEEIVLLEVQRMIKSQVAMKLEAREFFTEKQLGFIEPYLEKLNLGEEEKSWIARSRAYVQTEREAEAKRQAIKLEEAKRQAEQERILREQAEQAKFDADFQKNQALYARDEAENQKTKAIEAKEDAEKQRAIAQVNERQARWFTHLAIGITIFALLLATLTGWFYFKLMDAKEEAVSQTKSTKLLLDNYLKTKKEKEKGEFSLRLDRMDLVLRGKNCPDKNQMIDLDTMKSRYRDDLNLSKKIDLILSKIDHCR